VGALLSRKRKIAEAGTYHWGERFTTTQKRAKISPKTLTASSKRKRTRKTDETEKLGEKSVSSF